MSKEEQIASLQSELARKETLLNAFYRYPGHGTPSFWECNKCDEPFLVWSVVAGNQHTCHECRLRAEKERAEKAESELERARQWRTQLLDCWAKDHRATMTALLEGGWGVIE